MKRRVLAWLLLLGFIFIIINVTMFFLNVRLSEFHGVIVKISAVVYFIVLFILLLFKIRTEMRDRNKLNLREFEGVIDNLDESSDTASDTPNKKINDEIIDCNDDMK